MKRRSRYLAVVVALMVVVASCSDDGGGSPFAEESSGTSAADDSDGDSSGDTDGDTLDDLVVGDLPGVEGECETLLSIGVAMAQVFGGPDASVFESADLSGLPGEVQDDAEILLDAMAEFNAGLQDLGIDLTDPASLAALTAEQAEQFDALANRIDSDEVEQASDNLSAYAEAECNLS